MNGEKVHFEERCNVFIATLLRIAPDGYSMQERLEDARAAIKLFDELFPDPPYSDNENDEE